MFGRLLNPFEDFSNEQLVEDKGYQEQYRQVRERLQFMSDVLFPAIQDRLLGHAARAITTFARSKKIIQDPFPAGSFVMIRPSRCTKALSRFFGELGVAATNFWITTNSSTNARWRPPK